MVYALGIVFSPPLVLLILSFRFHHALFLQLGFGSGPTRGWVEQVYVVPGQL
jgi:hypothetical protein